MSFALSLTGNRAEAEDACQDMILQMLRHLDRFDENSDLKCWAFTILYRKCLDQLRKRRRFLNFFRSASEVRQSGVEDSPVNRLEEAISENFLSRLSATERTCLFLWAREGYSSEEIAGILGCSPGTVRVHLFQARRKLKEMLGRGNEKRDDEKKGLVAFSSGVSGGWSRWFPSDTGF